MCLGKVKCQLRESQKEGREERFRFSRACYANLSHIVIELIKTIERDILFHFHFWEKNCCKKDLVLARYTQLLLDVLFKQHKWVCRIVGSLLATFLEPWSHYSNVSECKNLFCRYTLVDAHYSVSGSGSWSLMYERRGLNLLSQKTWCVT